MRRRSTRARMGLRGRSGVLAYMLFGTAVLMAVYYVWNNFFFTASSKITYSSVQGLKPDHVAQWDKQKQQGFVMEEPPIGLSKEIEIQMANEKWKKAKALQDRIDEERLLEEQAARQNAVSRNSNDQRAQDSQRDGGNGQQKEGLGSKPLLFEQADALDGNYFAKLERLVHLDLKGAPPRVSYLEQLFPVLKKLGATGLLMEYEDMFPYTGNISILASAVAYSQSDLLRIRAAAKSSGLEIIPLVQTFGHLEFVLKYQHYRGLREHDYTPQVITPVKEESYTLLFNILDQVMAAHPDSRRIHLGCDEVYELGNGQSNSFITSQRISPIHLFLRHVSKVARHVRKTAPHFQPLIWDDWLRKMPFDVLADSGLQGLVEPVVWYYAHNILERVPMEVWDMYGKLFPAVWVASAFKGATGSAQILTNASVHLDNNLQWVRIMRTLGAQVKKVNFRGTVLTGWQRYDHFATLCELLPVGLPSLALSLQAVRVGGFGPRERLTAGLLLNCSSKLDLEFPTVDKNGAHVSQDCRFPGSLVFYSVQQLWGIMEAYRRDRGLQERIAGWMTDYQFQQGISNPGQMRLLAHKLSKMLDRLRELVSPMRNSLLQIYDLSTVDEWMATNIDDPTTHIKELLSKAKKLLERKDWPARPFPQPARAGDQMVIQPGAGQQQRRSDAVGQYVPHDSSLNILPQGPEPSRLRPPGNPQGVISKVTVLPNPGEIAKEGGAQYHAGGADKGGNAGRPGGGIMAQALFPKADINAGRPSGPGKVQAYNTPAGNVLNLGPQGVRSGLSGQRQQQQVRNPAGLGQYIQVLPLNPKGVQQSPNQQAQGQNQRGLSQNQLGLGQIQQGLGQNQQGLRQYQQGLPQNQLRLGQNQQGFGLNQQGLRQYQQGQRLPQNQLGFGQNQQRSGQNQQGLGQNQQGPGQNQQGLGQNQQGFGQNQQRSGQNQQGFGQNQQGQNWQRSGQDQQGLGQNQQGFGQNQQGQNWQRSGQDQQGLGQNQQGLGQNQQGAGQDQQGQNWQRSGQDQQGLRQNLLVLPQKIQGPGQSHQNVLQNFQTFGQNTQEVPQNPPGLIPNPQGQPQSAQGEKDHRRLGPLTTQDPQNRDNLKPFGTDKKEERVGDEEKSGPVHGVGNGEKESDKDEQLQGLPDKEVPVKDFGHQDADADDKDENGAASLPKVDKDNILLPGNRLEEPAEADGAGDEGAKYLDRFVGRKSFGGNSMNHIPVKSDEDQGKALDKFEQEDKDETDYEANGDI